MRIWWRQQAKGSVQSSWGLRCINVLSKSKANFWPHWERKVHLLSDEPKTGITLGVLIWRLQCEFESSDVKCLRCEKSGLPCGGKTVKSTLKRFKTFSSLFQHSSDPLQPAALKIWPSNSHRGKVVIWCRRNLCIIHWEEEHDVVLQRISVFVCGVLTTSKRGNFIYRRQNSVGISNVISSTYQYFKHRSQFLEICWEHSFPNQLDFHWHLIPSHPSIAFRSQINDIKGDPLQHKSFLLLLSE